MKVTRLWIYYGLIIWCIPWCHAATSMTVRWGLAMLHLDPANSASLIGATLIASLAIVASNFRFQSIGRYGTVALLLAYILVSQAVVISRLQAGYYSQSHKVPLTPVVAAINVAVIVFLLGRPYRKLYAEFRARQREKEKSGFA